MHKDNIEIISSFNQSNAVHRIKMDPIITQMGNKFNFCNIGEGNGNTVGVLINGLYTNLKQRPAIISQLNKHKQNSVIMLFIADFNADLVAPLKEWSQFVDVFLVPTPETRNLVQAFTYRSVEVLFDPIDFGFNDSFSKPMDSNSPIKIVWFGYPESYTKSMTEYENILIDLHRKKEIEYHLITRNNSYGDAQKCIIHQYIQESFPALLQTFDVCVLSHSPFDFHINTYSKSENKAVLAINRGLPVIASRTPAYERLLKMCGLDEYLFSSSAELLTLVRKLKSAKERESYLKLSQKPVLENYSANKMVNDWFSIYTQAYKIKFKNKKQAAG